MGASASRCRNGAYGGGCGGRAAGCRVWRTGPDTGSAGSRSGCRRSHNGGIRGSAPTDGRSSSNTADRRGRIRIARRWPCTISRWPGASRRAHRPHLVSNRPPATGQTFCAAFVNCSRLIHEKCVNRSSAVNAGVWRGRSPVVLRGHTARSCAHRARSICARSSGPTRDFVGQLGPRVPTAG